VSLLEYRVFAKYTSKHHDSAFNPIPMDIDAIHKALANPVRREILAWLKEPEIHFGAQELPLENGVCAGQIDARCEMSQSTVSAHLATLHRAGLVTSKRIGQWVFFKRDETVIQAFLEHIRSGL
jgi:DNA-binding transcriptional ArsR family regulator